MVMEDPGALVRFADRIGLYIGDPSEAPTRLLGRLLQQAHAFIDI